MWCRWVRTYFRFFFSSLPPPVQTRHSEYWINVDRLRKMKGKRFFFVFLFCTFLAVWAPIARISRSSCTPTHLWSLWTDDRVLDGREITDGRTRIPLVVTRVRNNSVMPRPVNAKRQLWILYSTQSSVCGACCLRDMRRIYPYMLKTSVGTQKQYCWITDSVAADEFLCDQQLSPPHNIMCSVRARACGSVCRYERALVDNRID